MDFFKFFFTSEDKILETNFYEVSATTTWLQWEWFSLS